MLTKNVNGSGLWSPITNSKVLLAPGWKGMLAPSGDVSRAPTPPMPPSALSSRFPPVTSALQ